MFIFKKMTFLFLMPDDRMLNKRNGPLSFILNKEFAEFTTYVSIFASDIIILHMIK